MDYDAANDNIVRVSARQPTLADVILTSGQRTLIVLPGSGLVLMQQLTGRTITPDQYAEHRYDPETLPEVPGDVLAFWLLRLRPDAANGIALYRARHYGARPEGIPCTAGVCGPVIGK